MTILKISHLINLDIIHRDSRPISPMVISIRQIWQEAQKSKSKIKNKISINQYMARLKWHCHFIQKFETDPTLEFINMNPAFNSLRKSKNRKLVKS